MDRALDLAFTLLEKPCEAGELLLAVFERARSTAIKTGAQSRDHGLHRLTFRGRLLNVRGRAMFDCRRAGHGFFSCRS